MFKPSLAAGRETLSPFFEVRGEVTWESSLQLTVGFLRKCDGGGGEQWKFQEASVRQSAGLQEMVESTK